MPSWQKTDKDVMLSLFLAQSQGYRRGKLKIVLKIVQFQGFTPSSSLTGPEHEMTGTNPNPDPLSLLSLEQDFAIPQDPKLTCSTLREGCQKSATIKSNSP